MAKNTEGNTALAVQENEYLLPALNNIGEAMAEEMDGLQLTFDRVKIPSGGGVAFEVPGDDPDSPDTEKELIGVIVDHHPVNAYWAVKYDGANNPPDCSSMDGKVGTGDPGGSCKACPYNQFGSDGNGKACKNMHRVYVLRDGETFPLLLTLPPTSLKNFADFLGKRVVGKGLRSYAVKVKVTLKKAINSTGITYSQAVFALVERLTPEAADQARSYSNGIKAITRNLAVADDEYVNAEPIEEAY